MLISLISESDCQVNGTKGVSYRGEVSTSIEGNLCVPWSSYSWTSTDLSREQFGTGDHNYCRNPSNHDGLWCYTSENWDWGNCDHGDHGHIPICEEETRTMIEKSILTIADHFNIDLHSVKDSETILEDEIFEAEWKVGYSYFLILSAKENIGLKMLSSLLINSPPNLVLQTVFSLMQGVENLNIKQSKEINHEETQNMAREIFHYLEKLKGLKVREIYKALAIKNAKTLKKYKDIFIDDGSTDFERCLSSEDSESCQSMVEAATYLKGIPYLQELSSHPAHLQLPNGKTSPSAFIPFCKIGNKLQGVQMENFSRPVCSAFIPKLFEGQFCYAIDINEIGPFDSGLDNGLELIIDFNEERSIAADSRHQKGRINISWG